jgi:hypothetical protein
VHVIQYRLLCGRIMPAPQSVRQPGNEVEDVRHLRDKLLSELNTWRLATSKLITSEMNISPMISKNRSSFLSTEWYEVLYHNVCLCLQPSSTLSDMAGGSSTLEKLYSSSKQAVVHYAGFYLSRKMYFESQAGNGLGSLARKSRFI